MLKKYEVRTSENGQLIRQYVPNLTELSRLLQSLRASSVIGVYKLQLDGEGTTSEQLDWKFKGNTLSLKSNKKRKTVSSDIIPLNQEQLDKLWEELSPEPTPIDVIPEPPDRRGIPVRTSTPRESKIKDVATREPKIITAAPREPKTITAAPRESKIITAPPREPKVITAAPREPKIRAGSPRRPRTKLESNSRVRISSRG